MARCLGSDGFAAAPGDEAAACRHEAHRGAQQRRLAGAVGADQHRRQSGRNRERDAVENRHRARRDANVDEHDRQIEGGWTHAHPA